MVSDPGEAVLNRTWRPFLSVVGANGLPAIKDAGNVLRPQTALKLSLRIPPLIDGDAGYARFEAHSRSRSAARREGDASRPIKAQPAGALRLRRPGCKTAVERASQTYFGKPAAMMGEGGTIPFMAMLGKYFPQAQFLITGVLGPKSNAHGPNEFLHVEYAKKLTCCVAQVIAEHARAS